jgi:hypothetical protein
MAMLVIAKGYFIPQICFLCDGLQGHKPLGCDSSAGRSGHSTHRWNVEIGRIWIQMQTTCLCLYGLLMFVDPSDCIGLC